VRPDTPARRIVSLVPSLTESLFALGLGDRVVGVTDWCVHPAAAVAALPRVGGTKTPHLDAVRALRPDLVLANREENRKRDVERLEADGLPVWVTYPRTVRDGALLLRELAALGADEEAVDRVVVPVEQAVDEASRVRPLRPSRVFCPIWKGPWMSVGADTYAHDLLSLCGGENVFAERADRRYPRVSEEDIVAAAPEVVLLPDEPYRFGAPEVEALRCLDVPAARNGRIHCIDGTLVSWYGPRIAQAVAVVRPLLAPRLPKRPVANGVGEEAPPGADGGSR